MFWGSLTETQQKDLYSIAVEVNSLQPSFERNKFLLYDVTLTWFQCFCVEHCYISRGTLVSLGTGLGKTMVGISLIRRVLLENKGSLGLFFCIPSSVEQIAQDFSKYCDLRTLILSGQQLDILYLKNTPIQSYDVIVVSYEALYSLDFCNWLMSNIDFFRVAVYDEVHRLSQISLINSICGSLMSLLDWNMMLSATPITVSPKQPITLLNMLDRSFIPNGNQLLEKYCVRDPLTHEVIDYVGLEDFTSEIYPRYVSWTRDELGLKGNYKPHLYIVEPTDEQRECTYVDAYKIIKGQRGSKQVELLKALVQEKTMRGLKGLVYVFNLELADLYYEELLGVDIRVGVANGDDKYRSERQNLLKQFTSSEVDCILTNLTESLNLSCDYIIFMQNTNNAIQMIGRAERGFMPRDLEIDYILTEDTIEIEQFYRNVYKRCKWMGDMLSKDIDVFERFKKGLEKFNLL